MTWAIRSPHAVLQPLVSRYIGYEQHDVALSVHRGLPSRHVTLIISLQDPVRMSGRAGPVSVQGDQAHLAILAHSSTVSRHRSRRQPETWREPD